MGLSHSNKWWSQWWAIGAFVPYAPLGLLKAGWTAAHFYQRPATTVALAEPNG